MSLIFILLITFINIRLINLRYIISYKRRLIISIELFKNDYFILYIDGYNII